VDWAIYCGQQNVDKSLRRQLLGWVLVPLACAVSVGSWLTYESSADTAGVVQDRLLLGSARMMAEEISFSDGSFQHHIPPAALELFQYENGDRIFYRTTTGTGQLLSGHSDLPLPDVDLVQASPYFFQSKMRGLDVRVVAFLQPVVGNPAALPVIVEVAQTSRTKLRLTNKLWLQSVEQQLLILLMASVFILFGLSRGLRPLIRLRNQVMARNEGSLEPLETRNIPAELMPLVESINDYIQRLESYTNKQSMFVQNAAHQLRTPLAVLTTQISDAHRAQNAETTRAALTAARTTLQHTTRLVNQFLLLSSAEASQVSRCTVTAEEFCAIVQKAIEHLAPRAYAKSIDLGLERHVDNARVQVDPVAIREIVLNLLDNAIRYTPDHGVVTVRVALAQRLLLLSVEDNGPGVPVESLAKIFDRFYRAGRVDMSGAGLGLAIVRELTIKCGGVVRAARASSTSSGLVVEVEFPSF